MNLPTLPTCLKNIVIQAMIGVIGITWMIKNKVELQITKQQLKHMKKGTVITKRLSENWLIFVEF